jgi:hypothetical protein
MKINSISHVLIDKKLSLIIYNIALLITVLVFIVLVFFGDFLGGLLSPLVLFVTVLAVFSFYKYGFYGPYYLLFVLIPFSQSVTILTVAGRPVNMGMHTMVVGMILIGTMMRKSLRFHPLKDVSIKYLIFLGIWTLITILISSFYSSVSAISNSFVTWMRFVQFIPIAYLMVQGVGFTKYFKSFVYLFITLGFIVSLWGIYEILNPTDFTLRAFRGAATFTKPLFRELNEDASFSLSNTTGGGDWYMGSANYNIAGAFMAVITLITIPFLSEKKIFNGFPIGKIGIVILVIGIAVTYSRSAFFAFLLGLLLNSSDRSKKSLISMLFFFALCGVVFFAFFSDYWLGPLIKEIFSSLPDAISMALNYGEYTQDMGFSVNVYGAAMRLVGIREAFVGFIQKPIFGWGFFAFAAYAPNLGTAENFYMQFLCETGLIGFFALFQYLRFIWKKTNTEFPLGSFPAKYQRGFRGAFIAFLIVNITGTLFYDTRIWGLMLVLSAIQIRFMLDEQKRVKKDNKI